MTDWEELYAKCLAKATQPRIQLLTTDPRLAVALAYEDGMRTQSMADLFEAGKEGKKPRTVRGIESREKRAGTGADVYAEYHKIRRYVDGLLESDPLRYAVIMTLAPVKESVRQACKGEVYDMLYDRVRMALAERGERVLAKRAERLIALSRAAVEQSMRGAELTPKHIAVWCEEWCGVSIDKSHWNRECAEDWGFINSTLDQISFDSYSFVTSIIRIVNAMLKKAG